jgi:beta-glucosidase
VPLKQLKGVKKVFIPKGKKVRVSFSLAKEDISFWSEDSRSWQNEKGNVVISIGTSSKDIRLQSLLDLNK